jgi:SAM-dependent methyltransferase
MGGYFASADLLADVCGPLLQLDEIRGRRVAEVGSGQGRVVDMLLDAGATHVLAMEPSDAFLVLERNLRARRERVTLLRATGDQIPATGDLDLVFSIGVLHHVPEPGPVVLAAREALRPGGRLLVWLYGREGNRLLLSFLLPLRRFTQRLPHAVLDVLVRLLDLPVRGYILLCRIGPLPMRRYFRDVIGRFGTRERRLTIYDQLNPAYARYYTEGEARALLAAAGFADVRLHHRHGYSWTVVGTRPQ